MYQRIRDLREDRDLLLKGCCGVSEKCTPGLLLNYETGKRDIPTEVLIQLAGLYHTSTDYILGRTTAPRPSPAKRKTAPKAARFDASYFWAVCFDVKIFHYGPAWKGSCKRVHTGLSVKNDFSRLSKASRKQRKRKSNNHSSQRTIHKFSMSPAGQPHTLSSEKDF